LPASAALPCGGSPASNVESRDERFTQIADEFTQINVDVIVTAGAGIIAAKRVTSTIPIVFALSNDPVGAGLVASLARLGGNIFGLSTQLADLPGKRLQLAREMMPGMRRKLRHQLSPSLGLMFNLGFHDAVARRMATELTARGIPTPNGAKWHGQTVRRMINRVGC
jgi:putative ABC transport system substrate-binding protein